MRLLINYNKLLMRSLKQSTLNYIHKFQQQHHTYIMQQSSVSYRSNRYSTQSRRNSNAPVFPTILQQQQIQQLQNKVDMILLHNGQLLEENAELKHQIEMMNLRRSDARLSSAENAEEVYFLKRELELKCLEIQEISRQRIIEKDDHRAKFDELSIMLTELRANYHKALSQKQQMERKLTKLQQERERQINRIKQQFENQVYQNSLKKQIEHKQELREMQHEHNKLIEKLTKAWEEEKLQIEEQKMNTILNIEQRFQREKEEVRKHAEEEFELRINKIKQDAEQKCRKVRDQSEAYIKTMLEQYKDEQKPDEQLKKQIESLKQSLEQRQKVISSLLKFNNHPLTDGSLYYKQVQDLRQRIKQLTEGFFQQSELLKVKMAVKHDIDVRQMIRVYEDRIDTLTAHINFLESDKKGLRDRYEDQIRSKMKQRQKFEIEVSKLKNYIRKMKIQLQSYGKQMRLNIEGIRDQANSFSMSILGELGQEKNKKNFYEEQIRKMREVIDLKDNEMEVFIKQCQGKLLYNEERLKNAKKTIEDLSEQLENKEEKFRQQFDTYKDLAREDFEKEKQYWTEKTEQLKKQAADLHKQVDRLEHAYKQSQSKNSILEKDLQKLNHELESHKAHIQSLKIELQMAGQEINTQQITKPLKQHYERIVQELQHDKVILKQTNGVQAQQMSKLIAKYKVLQKSVQKTLSTMKKKTVLEQKVMELGMDNNLVKNLEEVFRRSEEEKQNV